MDLNKKKILLVFSLFFCLSTVISQNNPVLKQQISIDEVSKVISDNIQNAFILKNGDVYTLIDQGSKIQLGSMAVDIGSYGIPGLGEMHFWENNSFVISNGSQLIRADIISGQTDTLFNEIKFPEFIINFLPLPSNKELILVAAKTYPVSKDGSVNFSKAGKDNQTIYDDSKNCRLILFDSRTKKIIRSVNTTHAITAFDQYAYHNKILAGTFEGDIIEIDSMLAIAKLFHPFNMPVHSILQQQEQIIAVPHLAVKYIGLSGGGTIYFMDRDSKKTRSLKLPAETPILDSEFGLRPGPSSNIVRIFHHPADNSVLVNYGFSRLVKISLSNLDSSHFSIPFNAANFYCFNRDGSQLLAAVSSSPGVFGLSGEISMYDLQQQKFQHSFKKADIKMKYYQIYKMFDDMGNYHFVGKKADFGNSDTLIIYSSNKTSPTYLINKKGSFVINVVDTTLILEGYQKTFYGKLKLQNLLSDKYVFNIGYDRDEKDTLHPEIFQIELNTQTLSEKDIPGEMTGISRLNNNGKLISGYDYKNKQNLYWIRVIDSTGKLQFSISGLELAYSDKFFKLSPSRNLLAITFVKNKTGQLEVWNLLTGKKIFEKAMTNGYQLQHFTFDKSSDVLWFGQLKLDKPIDIFKVGFNEPLPKADLVFSNCCFLSFETDMANNLVASENYQEINVHRLSDQKRLWHVEPATSFIKVFNQPNGFSFSSENEYHVITTELDYLYFTTYQGNKPVEIWNDYLYKGDKAAINNLAFVLNRKGYLPGDFDMYFNRPDSILLKSGSTNSIYNNLVAKAVEKRQKAIKEKNPGNLFINSPVISIEGRKQINDIVKSDQIKLRITATPAPGKKLGSLHVIDNGVPLFGNKGQQIQSAGGKVETEIIIPLIRETNNLEFFVSDEDGNVSARENISLFADYAAAPEKIFFLGIGIDEFTDSKYNLRYSAKDIRDLSIKLKEKYASNITIDTLFNEQVTLNNVKALKQKLLQTGINDKVIVSYSGHGMLSKDFDYYLSTFSVNFNKPEENGLAYSELEKLLDSIPARKKLLLIDACHSGEVDKEDLVALNETSDTLIKGIKPVAYKKDGQLGLKNSFELMQSLFVNVGKSTGATIISAAAGTQFALERSDLKNGVFTYSILEAMKNHPQMKISELKAIVGKRVEELTNGLQKPTSRNETIAVDWSIW